MRQIPKSRSMYICSFGSPKSFPSMTKPSLLSLPTFARSRTLLWIDFFHLQHSMISLPVRKGASRKLSSLSDLGRSYQISTLRSNNVACHCTPHQRFSTGKLAYQARTRTQPSRPTQVVSARNATTATAAKTAIPIKAPVGRPSPALSNNSRLSTDTPPSNPPTSLKEPSVTDLTNPANQRALTDGLLDSPPVSERSSGQIDWSTSFQGLSNTAFAPEAAAILLQSIDPQDIEIKPDGIIYLPEIKYRRILNRAFGPGAWGLAPRGETTVTPKSVTREYGLVVHGR